MDYKHLIKAVVMVFFITVASVLCVKGQDVIASTGESMKSEDFKLDWTLGEGFIDVHRGNRNMVTQGFHNSELKKGQIDMGQKVVDTTEVRIRVYPNPVKDFLKVNIDHRIVGNMSYTLSNLRGKVLKQKNMEYNNVTISMGGYYPATYLLRIIKNDEIIGIFKIIKN